MNKQNVIITFKENVLKLLIDDKEIRSIENPISGNIYKFNHNGEKCWFSYEESRIMRRVVRRIYLYPINLLEDSEDNIIRVSED